ncbi:enoyl-CoA hydratase-related protein [Saccharopolyspora indica]|uniref:enoyl-CoA-hydratase DpgD n=1 Tax=Saccharopolyspora indica TaxID=1229659 RepID=UPI0022EA5CCE|nr:enoyl-CoA-hydratase DpgD [Saccharopolyspora indica]MDA3647914.1 enoyl-CoA hydratase-related protein [Saccharopolyspora indica]
MTSARPRVRYEKRGRVARVTLDRPQVLNAMDLRMHAELAEIWDDFEQDDEIWVGVLTGEGNRAFSVGQDLKERVAGGSAPSTFGSRGLPGWPRLTERFELSKPVIARVNGYALGGGFELALACDIIVAAEHATFALPEARLGLVAGAGGVFRLTKQLPFKTALGHLMTGRRLSAARAFELGLANDVAPVDELDECVDGWVQDVLRCAPLAVRAVKEAATTSATLPLDRAFATRYRWEEERMRSNDAVEGPRAFVEKRPPEWTGT